MNFETKTLKTWCSVDLNAIAHSCPFLCDFIFKYTVYSPTYTNPQAAGPTWLPMAAPT